MLVFEQSPPEFLNRRSSSDGWDRLQSLKATNLGNEGPHADMLNHMRPSAEVLPTHHHFGANTHLRELSTDSWMRSNSLNVSTATKVSTVSSSTDFTPDPDDKTTPFFGPRNTKLSQVPIPSRLNSSKQLLNKTKGSHSRNHTSETEEQQDGAQAEAQLTAEAWLASVALGAALICLCCCAVLGLSRCRPKQQGQYHLGQQRSGSGQHHALMESS